MSQFATYLQTSVVDRPVIDKTGLADFADMLAMRGNDLTEAAVSLQPIVGEVLAILGRAPAVRYCAMSGSGATCFALFDDVAQAQAAAQTLPTSWWRHVGRFASP